jgi:hypothetical protein
MILKESFDVGIRTNGRSLDCGYIYDGRFDGFRHLTERILQLFHCGFAGLG